MPVPTEKAITITARLYEIRDIARRGLGERYTARMAEYADAIRQIAKAKQLTDLQAATEMGKVAQAEGRDGAFMCVMAAYVEMVEPSAMGVRHG